MVKQKILPRKNITSLTISKNNFNFTFGKEALIEQIENVDEEKNENRRKVLEKEEVVSFM